VRGELYKVLNENDKATADIKAALEAGETPELAYDLLIDMYIEKEDFLTALEYAVKELKEYDNPENRLRTSRLYSELDLADEAIEMLERAALDFRGYERIHRRLAEQYEAVTGEFEKAIAQYEIITSDDSADYSDDIAYCLCMQDRYEDAMQLLDAKISEFPGDMNLYIRRGLTHIDSCRPEDALKDLLTAVSNTEAVSYVWRLDVIYDKIGFLYEGWLNDAPSGAKYYNLALELNEKDSYAHLCLGDIERYYYRNISASLDHYCVRAQLTPDDPKIWLKLADALAAALEGKPKPSTQFPNTRKNKFNPDNINAGILESDSDSYLAMTSAYKRAYSMYKAILAGNPSDACTNCHLGDCLLGLGKYKKASKHYIAALKNPKRGSSCPPGICHEAYYGISRIYAKLRDYKKALKYIDMAIGYANGAEYNAFKRKITEILSDSKHDKK
jgi:tetratricopeptide (TPR) repeat protein